MSSSSTPSVLIIGGGPAGLAAGIYARKAGLRPIVLEQHDLPGGLCTAWERQGYTIDGCLHILMGSGPGSPFHGLFRELGVFDRVDPVEDFVYHKHLFTHRFANGVELGIPCDPDELERELTTFSPTDAHPIRELAQAVRDFAGFAPPVDLMRGPWNLIRGAWAALPYALPLLKWKRTSIASFAARFRSRELREGLVRLWYPDYSMLYVLMLMDGVRRRYAGYPKFNSLGLSKILASKLEEAGGELRYGARVTRILREGARAVGVTLDGGETLRGDYIIAAAASDWTLRELLPDHQIPTRDHPVTPPVVHVALGSSYDFTGVDTGTCGMQLELTPPVHLNGGEHPFLLVHVYNFTDQLAPTGRTLVKVIYPSSHARWRGWQEQGRKVYLEQKRQATQGVMDAMDRYFPGFSDTVDMTDVATPLTFHRYTSNQEGSLIAWGALPDTPMSLDRTVKGIERLYLAGHWVMPGGGVPQAVMSGRQAIQAICMDEKIRVDWTLPT